MATTPTHAETATRPQGTAPVSPGVGRLVRTALIAAALGLAGTGVFLVADPNDQIGAWLQIGAGIGLAATALRPALWAGGLVAAIAIAAGLVVGHLADYFGAADSTIGPVAIGLTLVLLALSSTAGVVYSRSVQ